MIGPICLRDDEKKTTERKIICTVCPRSSDPFYVVSYYIKRVTTSYTYSNIHAIKRKGEKH